MKYFPLIWAGLWRKRARTFLTLLSVIVAFSLFGVMHGVTAGLDDAIETLSDTRLRIQSRVSIGQGLPLAHLSVIESVPGVEKVGFYTFFGGYYQDARNQINSGAVDAERLDAMFPELVLPPEQLEAMARTRNGALVGQDLATERGWKIGDIIPLKSSVWTRKDGSSDWTFEIVGIYDFANEALRSVEFWINYDYFDEARALGNGVVTLYFAQIDDPSRAAEIADDIDRRFLNSAFETQTQNEKDWMRAQISQLGDIDFFVNAIIGAVFFTLLFLTGNTMMQSVRERIPELAVMKTYGYTDATVVAFVVAESILLCAAAAFVGLAIAAGIFPNVFRALGVSALPMPVSVMASGAVIALFLALVSAAPPAWRARSLSIVDALAHR